ncbi:hypothetical protein V6Z12_A09G059500 [Gossypium hirsutum]
MIIISNLAKLEFATLNISSKKYLSWVLDAEIQLDAKGLGNTIVVNKEASNQDKEKAMILIRHHLHEGLKVEYLFVKDPFELWKNLKKQFDHQKTVILLKACYDWMHLWLQDFKTVSEYNSELFKISSQLKLCGENITNKNLLEKTFSTFHATNVLLQQQYYEIVAEQNNGLLMKNHDICPTGNAPLPEVNATVHNKYGNKNIKVEIMIVVVVMDIVGDVVEDVLVTATMVFIIVAFLSTGKRIAMKDKKEVVKIILQRLLRIYVTDVV